MNVMDVAREFETEEECLAHLEKVRWPDGVHCPSCGNSRISRFQAKGKTGKVRHLYQCLEKTCRHQFSATTGTIFHDSHLPLKKWFTAIALVRESKEGISANQLRRDLEVQYKTAWQIAQRIREATQRGTIETDQTHASQKRIDRTSPREKRPAPGLEARPAVAINPIVSKQIATRYVRQRVRATAADNVWGMFRSLTQITFQPLFFANYLVENFLLDKGTRRN